MDNIFNYVDISNERIIGDMASTRMNGIKSGVTVPNKIIIPKLIDGVEIKAIGSYTFYQCLIIEECIIEARINTIYRWAFQGCQNLRYINIPSSVLYLKNAAIDGRNNNTYGVGPITIYFERKSKLMEIENAGISNFDIINVFLYDKINPTNSTHMFGNVKNLTIYSRYSYKFCGFQTLRSPVMNQCFNSHAMNYHVSRNFVYMLALLSS